MRRRRTAAARTRRAPSDLHIGRDARATAVHGVRGAPAVVAVVVAAGAVGCVHRHGDPAVQVAVGPAGHVAVGHFAGVRHQAGTSESQYGLTDSLVMDLHPDSGYLPFLSELCLRGFIRLAGTSF